MKRLDEIRERWDKATPGPWKAHDTWNSPGGYCATVLSGEGNSTDLRAWLPTFSSEPQHPRPRNVTEDADAIAHAPADVCRTDRRHSECAGPAQRVGSMTHQTR